MRVLGIGNYNDLGSIYMRCASEGHDARVFIAEEGSRDVLQGLVHLLLFVAFLLLLVQG